MRLNMARMIEHTRSEGPGMRTAIWVQGCPIRCPGCCNPDMIPLIDREWVEVEALAGRIGRIEGIEGVTFLGGEPFAQAEALAELGQCVQALGLSVVTFSGYTLEQIHALAGSEPARLLVVTDLLIAGPFVQGQYTERKLWIGSDNQQLHYLTDRYVGIDEKLDPADTNTVEIQLTPEGELRINGFPYAGLTQDALKALLAQGFKVRRQT